MTLSRCEHATTGSGGCSERLLGFVMLPGDARTEALAYARMALGICTPADLLSKCAEELKRVAHRGPKAAS